MKKAFSILLFMCITIFSQAQTSKDQAFVELNKLLSKAKGQKYTNDVIGGSETVSEQQFSETIIISRSKRQKTEWVTRYQEMDWTALKDYHFMNPYENEKLKVLELKFNEGVDFDKYTTDDEGGQKHKLHSVEVYILEKDQAEVERLINVIGLHFSKLK